MEEAAAKAKEAAEQIKNTFDENARRVVTEKLQEEQRLKAKARTEL